MATPNVSYREEDVPRGWVGDIDGCLTDIVIC